MVVSWNRGDLNVDLKILHSLLLGPQNGTPTNFRKPPYISAQQPGRGAGTTSQLWYHVGAGQEVHDSEEALRMFGGLGGLG